MKVNVGQATRIVLPVKATSIKGTVKVGNALEVHLANGNVITLEDYFPSKPKLLTNEDTQTVAEIVINDDGAMVGIKALSADETASLLGNGYSSLSTSAEDILLLTPHNAVLAGVDSYDIEVFAASAALLFGLFALSDRNSESVETTIDNGGNTGGKNDPSLKPSNVDVQDNPNGNGDQVTGTTKPGADVVVKDQNGNVIGTGKADENGNFTVEVPPQKDGDKVTVETKDPTTGNTGSTEVTVGDKPLTPTNVDVQDNPNGNGDQVTGTTKPGADVVVKDQNGNVIGTGKADENGNFTVEVPPQKDGDKVTVETKDPTTGNTGSTEVAVGDKPLTPTNVDVQDNPNGNGDQVTGTTKPGADVVVKDQNGNVIGTGKADENGNFTVEVPPQKDGDKVTVETKDPTTGNTGSTEVTVGDKPLTPTNVDVQDNPNGNGDQVTGTTKPGADVVVKDQNGNVIGTGKADENGNFTVEVPPQKDGDKVTVETKDPTTGNTGSTEVTVGDKPLTPTNVDVQDNPNGNGDQVTGTTKPGADVVVKDQNGNVIGTGKADENGNFTVEVPPQKDGDKVTVETKDPTTGNTGSTEVAVGDKPLTPTNVDVQDNPNGNGDQVTGTTKPGADVVVKDQNGNVIGTGKADENGNFTVEVPPQKDGDKVTVETKDPTTGNTGSTEVTVGDKPLTPTNVDVQDNPNGNGDQVTGTTKPGADVVVKDQNGNVIGTGKADENGNFTVEVPPQKDGDKVTVETKDPTTGNTGSTEVAVGDKPLTPTNVDVQDNPNGNGDQVTGTTKPGADVVVKDQNGNVIGTGKADENGNFTVEVPPQKDGDKVTVETKDPTTGNTGSTEVTVGDKPLTPTNVDVQDNPNGNGDQVTGTTKPGADVVVKDQNGNVIGTGKADENGNFTVEVPPQKDGDKVTVETKDPTTGNTGSTEVAVGDKPLTPTNVDVQDNPNGNGDQVTGTTKPGADVVVKDQNGNVIGTGKADENGNFTVEVPPQKDGDKVTVETKDPTTGNTGSTEVTVGDKPLTPTNVDVQDNPNGNGDQVTGTTKPGADVVVKDQNGNVIGTGKADENGNFTVEVPPQKDGDKVTVETKDPTTGNTGSTEVTVGDKPLTPTNVDVQDNPNGNGDQVTGTTKPGADVVVKDQNGNVIGTGKADENGNFTVEVPPQKDGDKVTVETKDPTTGNTGSTEVAVGDKPLTPTNVDVQDNPNGNGDQVTGTTKPGADVVVKDQNGNVIGTGKADENGNFTVEVPPQKDGDKVTVETKDPTTGNTGSTEVTVGDKPLTPTNVDVQDNPNGNGDQVTGTTKPGADVVVKDQNGNVIGTGKADENGNFTVEVPPQKDGDKVTVETKDPTTGNTGSTEVAVGDKPLTPTNVDVQDNPNGNGDQVTGTTKPGADVVVKDQNGNVIGTGKADENGNFTVEVPPQKDGDKVTVETKDPTTGNTGSTEVTVGDKPLTPTNVDVQDNPNGNGDQVTGTTKPGADVVVKDQNGNVIGTGKADENGNFTVEVPPQKDGDKVTVETKDPTTGNTGSTEVTVGDKPLTPTNVDVQDNPNGNGDQVTGTTKPGADVVVKDQNGNVIGTGKADENGNFTVEVPPQKDGDKVTVETKDPTTGNTGSTEVAVGDKPLTPTNVDVQDNPNGNGDQVTGTTKPGADVVVKDQNGNVIGTGKADENGNFTVEVPPQKDGDKVTVETKDPTTGNTGSTTVQVGTTGGDTGTTGGDTGSTGGETSGTTGGSTGGETSGTTGGSTGGETSGTTGGSTGGETSGTTGGSTGGETSGTTGGSTGGETSGTTGGSTGGETSGTTGGSTGGETSGTTGGSTGGETSGTTGGSTGGETSGTTGGSTGGETSGTTGGSTGGETSGTTGGSTGGETSGTTGGSTGGETSGTTGGSTGGETSGTTGGSTGGETSGTTGGSTGGETSGTTGGSTGGETSGTTGGSTGGETSGTTGGSTGGETSGTTGGSTGGETSGTTGGSTGGETSGTTGGSTGGETSGTTGGSTGGETSGTTGGSTGGETSGTTGGSTGGETSGTTGGSTGGETSGTTGGSTGGETSGTTGGSTGGETSGTTGGSTGGETSGTTGGSTGGETSGTTGGSTGGETSGTTGGSTGGETSGTTGGSTGGETSGTTGGSTGGETSGTTGGSTGGETSGTTGGSTGGETSGTTGGSTGGETSGTTGGSTGGETSGTTGGSTGGETSGTTGGSTGGETSGTTGGSTGGETSGTTGGSTGGETSGTTGGSTGGETSGTTGGSTGGETSGTTGGSTGGETSGTTGGSTGGETSGTTGGSTGGETSGTTGGSTGGETSGTTGGSTGGETSGTTGGSTGGETSGTTGGSTGGETSGTTGGSTGGETSGTTGGSTGGETSGTTGGSTGGETSGTTGGSTGGETSGTTGGSTGGETSGTTGGSTGGETSGTTGGSTGGETSGTTGGSTGGETSGTTGGSTGGETSGTTGGSTGGETSGTTGGSTGGETSGTTGGSTGGETSGTTGGSTGGETSGTTGGSTGGETSGTTGGSTGGETSGTTGGSTGGETSGTTGGSTGGETSGTTGGSTGGETSGTTGGSTGGETSGTTGGSTGGETSGTTGGSTGGETSGTTGGSTGGETSGTTGGSTGGETSGTTGGSTGGETSGTTGGSTGDTGGDTGATGGNEEKDETPPEAPQDATINPQGTAVTGKAEPGSTVKVTDPTGKVIGSAKADDQGNFSVPLNPAQTNGETLGVTATDPAGNVSPKADTTNKAPDTTAPAAPTDATVNPQGTAVTGKAEPGSTVKVTDPTGKVIGSAKADDQGNFSVPLNPAATNGETLGVTATDPAGNVSPKADTTNKAPDTTAPAAPTEATVNPQGTAVTGKAEPGSTVKVTDPTGKVIGSAKADDQGNFSVPLNPAATNGETLGVTATDPAGNVSPKADTTNKAPDTTAPAAPTDATVNPQGTAVTGKAEPGSTVKVTDPTGKVIGSAKADDQGNFSVPLNPAATNGETLGVTATDPAGNVSPKADTTNKAPDTTAPAAPTEATVNPQGTAVTGKAEPGSTVKVTDPTGKVIGSAKADDQGNFSVPLNPAATNGETLGVTATDPAGNVSPKADTTNKAPDTTAPAAPTEATVNPQGTAVTGKAEPGSTVKVTDPTGKVIGSAKAGTDGSFSVPLNPAQTNGETLGVTATDPAGNVSPKADTTNKAPDTTAPAAPTDATVNPQGTAVTGKAEPGSTVKVTDPTGKVIGSAKAGTDGSFSVPLNPAQTNGETLGVTATDPAGNVSPKADTTNKAPDTTAPAAPTDATVNPQGTAVTGKAEPGSTVKVTDPTGKVIGSAKAGTDGSFSVPLNPAQTNGETLGVTATDPAGNVSPKADTTNKAPDTTAPAAPTDATVNPQGTAVTGKAEPGSTVKVTDPTGKVIGSAKAGTDGSFSVPLNPAQTNGETLGVTATDPAGNVSPKADTTNKAPDTTAPAAPTEATVNPQGTAVTGKAEPGSTVKVTDPTGKVIGSAKAGTDGSFSVPLSPAQTNGETLGVTATDPAGNVSPKANTTNKAPDTTAPAAPTEATVNPTGTAVTGKAEPGSTVKVTDPTGKVIGSAKAGTDGSFSVPLSPAQTNGETLGVTATDPAGNVSPKADTTNKAPDTTAPAAPTEATVNPQGTAVTGKAEPGSTVKVTDPTGKVIGSAKAGTDGSFSVPLSPAQTNGETLGVTATDPAGNVSPKANTTNKAPDTTAPAAPTEATVNPTGTAVTGKAEPGSTVKVTDPTGKVIGSAKAGTDGSFSVPLSPAQTNGETLGVTATDPAGNVSPKADTTNKAPDTTAPAVPTELVGSEDGLSVTGKAEPGATVKIMDAQGTVLGSATAGTDGSFTAAISPKQNNGEPLKATATDKAGNVSPEAPFNAQDKTPPALESELNENGTAVTGTAEPGSIVKVKAPDGSVIGSATADPQTGKFEIEVPATATEKISVTATDAAGNESEGQEHTLPDLSKPDTAFVAEGKYLYTYYDINYDGIVDRAEKQTFDKDIVVDREGKVTNDAKVVRIDTYLEGDDIDAGNGLMSKVKTEPKQNLDLTGADTITYITYDAQGNEQERFYNLDASNATGNRITAANGQTFAGIDKYETIVKSQTFNIDGKQVALPTEVAYNNDADTGEVYDARTYTQYDDKGQKTYVFYDDNADGKIDRAEHYSYDDNGNVIKVEYDNDANGVTGNVTRGNLAHSGTGYDKVEHFTYEKYTTDVNGAPVELYRQTAKYTNTDNSAATGKAQPNINGATAEGIDTIEKYDYNDYSRQTKIEYDNDGDGTTDKIHYQIFDSLGRIVQVLVDNDGKGTTGVTRTDNDGAPVAGIDQVLAYSYNVKGEVTEMKRDNNVDGKYDYREAYTLNANGNWIAKQVDLTNDGTFDRKDVYTKEADDGLVKTHFYNLVDDRDVLTKVEDYTLNTNNQRTSVKVDTLGDGTTDAVTRYDLDAFGRAAKAYFDTDGDGNVDRVEGYVRDARGDVSTLTVLSPTNGSVLSTTTYERNELGQVTKQRYESAEGSVEVQINQYDTYGNVIERQTYNSDDLSVTPLRSQWKYNELGQQIESLRTYADGTQQKWVRTFDEYGRTVAESYDAGNDGTINDTAYVREFDASNRATKYFIDTNGDAVFNNGDIIRVFEYNALGQITERREYRDEEETSLRRSYEYNYDSSGKSTSYYYDWSGDGVYDQFAFGGGVLPVSHTENVTEWNAQIWEKLRNVTEFSMTGTTTVSTLILDKETLNNFSKNRLYVFNGLEKDKVVLLNGEQDFTKTQDNATSGSRTYDVYATADGKELWIQDGITVDGVI